MPSAQNGSTSRPGKPQTGGVGKGNHVVAQGESIKTIAAEAGLPWPTIWNHPDNLELRTVRKDPNVLLPGDRVFVPAIEPGSVSRETGRRHTFIRKGATTELKLVLKAADQPRANERYTLVIDGKLTISGTTDGSGLLVEKVPVNARVGELILGTGKDRYELKFSHIDPDRELSGMQGRLNNLGFYCGIADGRMTPATRTAIQAFQNKHGLPVTGEPDEATRNKLKEEYGS